VCSSDLRKKERDNLKIQYLKDNPEIIIMEQAMPNEVK